MRVEEERRSIVLAAILVAAGLLAVLLVGGRPVSGETPPPPDAVQAAPSPGAPPSAPPAEVPPPSAPPTEAPPRIIRVVCTDHICGHCDGKCHKESGHVAVDKKGHCACTPTEGSALDRATRDAYEKNQPK